MKRLVALDFMRPILLATSVTLNSRDSTIVIRM